MCWFGFLYMLYDMIKHLSSKVYLMGSLLCLSNRLKMSKDCIYVFKHKIYVQISIYMLWCNFILGANFIFLCFRGMVMCDNV